MASYSSQNFSDTCHVYFDILSDIIIILTLLIQRAINDESDFLDDSAGSDLEDDKSDSSSHSSSPSEVSAVSDLSGDDRKTRSRRKKKEDDSDESDSDSDKQWVGFNIGKCFHLFL